MALVGARRARYAAATMGLFAMAACMTSGASPPASNGTVSFGSHLLTVELAADPPSREQGLMGRQSMAPDAGMLFIFPDRAPRAFWMRQTPLPLSIAFLADDGTIVHLADMQPHDDTLVPSRHPVRYALEVHQGWFAARGISVGAQARLQWPAGLPIR